MKTTDERPHLRRGLPGRGGSPIGWLRTLNWPSAIKVHIPLHRSQRRQKRAARLLVPGSFRTRKPDSEPGLGPFPSGYILQGRRINRSDPRRPAVPKRVKLSWAMVQRQQGGVDAGLPTVPAPMKLPLPQDARRASALTASRSRYQRIREQARNQSRRTRRLSPSHAFAESRAQASQSTAGLQSSRVPSQLSPNPNRPPDQTPLDCLHLVSAHPPCSRKGPLLPACGLKCPRRVKRETTNSRFLYPLVGTLPKFSENFGGGSAATSPTQVPPPASADGAAEAGRDGTPAAPCQAIRWAREPNAAAKG